ncbi:MAG: hypothetical protein ACLUEQ_08660 [Cloacibacillus evryensis]
MPVGTQATVKAMTPPELEGMGAQITRQHLSSAIAPRRGYRRGGWRTAPFHGLASPDPHRQRRFSGLFAREYK